MNWTKWTLIADKRYFYLDHIEYIGPAVYELGIGGIRTKYPQPVYVGETANEKKRICSYAKHGSHISNIIDWHLRQGWFLYYRGIATVSKLQAKNIQDNLLTRFKYDWNIISN